MLRVVLSWPHVQPNRTGGFTWRGFDRIVSHTARAGVQVLPILYGSAPWAVTCGKLSEADCRRRPPLESADARDAWQRFVGAAVERYGPDGTFWTSRIPPLPDPEPPDPTDPIDVPSVGPPPYTPITRWQVWNEPSSPTYWKPDHPDAKEYAKLVRLSSLAISSKDPAAEVLLAGLFGTPFGGGDQSLIAWRYLDRLYRVNGIESHFDAVALHPYAPNLRGISYQLRRVRTVMRKRGDGDTPIWITEIGWGSADPSEGPLLKGPDGQAEHLRTAFTRLRDRTAWNVAGILWFDWRDPPQYRGRVHFPVLPLGRAAGRERARQARLERVHGVQRRHPVASAATEYAGADSVQIESDVHGGIAGDRLPRARHSRRPANVVEEHDRLVSQVRLQLPPVAKRRLLLVVAVDERVLKRGQLRGGG